MAVKKIGVLTSGGDAPGMNSAVRAVTRSAMAQGVEVVLVSNGYEGLHRGDYKLANRNDVSRILNRGGTILKSARFPEFKEVSVRQEAIEKMKQEGIEALVVCGGDGSYMGAQKLTEMGVNCIGLPGTIDNDITSTDFTIGFDTALNTIVESLDKLRDTSESHRRCTIVEVMGRYCGDLAVNSGLACGAEIVATHENKVTAEEIIKAVRSATEVGKRHAIIVVTEHLFDVHELAKRVETETDYETRGTILGHVQRGGSPTAFDRILATKSAVKAIEVLLNGEGGKCIAYKAGKYVAIDILEALSIPRDSNEATDEMIKILA